MIRKNVFNETEYYKTINSNEEFIIRKGINGYEILKYYNHCKMLSDVYDNTFFEKVPVFENLTQAVRYLKENIDFLI